MAKTRTAPPSTAPERFVGTEAVAEFLGRPVSWVRNNAERLKIPRYANGNHWRYRLSEVEAWQRSKAAFTASEVMHRV